MFLALLLARESAKALISFPVTWLVVFRCLLEVGVTQAAQAKDAGKGKRSTCVFRFSLVQFSLVSFGGL